MRAKTFSRKFMLPISAGTMRLDADINSKCLGPLLAFRKKTAPWDMWNISLGMFTLGCASCNIADKQL